MTLTRILKNGLIDENPTLRLVLGTCPTLAISTSVINSLGMGVSATVVLVGSNLAISLLRNFIPSKVRIPAFITVIAGFVTIVQMLLKAYVPTLDKALGIFIPLIVVNCIILARAEAFASKNTPLASVVDGIGMGAGFTVALMAMGSFRELLGNGSLLGIKLLGQNASPALAMLLPPGGFLAFGLMIGLVNHFTGKKIRSSECLGCDGQWCKKLLKESEGK